MKKLSNVSPFLLLLFPVLVVMLMAFATSSISTNGEELASKTNNTTETVAKADTKILK